MFLGIFCRGTWEQSKMTTSSVNSSNPFAALTQGTAATATAPSATSTSTGTSAVNSAYNTFITLLTTQLQHQDPLNPTNTDTFTQELIQLSGVEQQLQTNNTLSTMSSDLTTMTQANGLGYVGKTITATGSTSPIQNGQAQWDYTLNSTAANVTLQVQDSSGNTVYSTSGNPASGQHAFSWNGQSTGGATASSGDYNLVVTAVDGSGNQVSTSTSMIGQVTGVDTSTGTTELKVGDISVPVTNVTQIN
jgi:flagellar basal-body rod modification protein FlgD